MRAPVAATKESNLQAGYHPPKSTSSDCRFTWKLRVRKLVLEFAEVNRYFEISRKFGPKKIRTLPLHFFLRGSK